MSFHDSHLEMLRLPYMFREYVHVSPDGKTAAWTWFGQNPAAQIYVAPTDGSAPPRRLTNTPHDAYVIGWTFDSRAMLVHQDNDGDERYRLFRIEREHPHEMTALTAPKPNYYLRGGNMHPNGRWIVYGANVDVATNTPIPQTAVIRQDLITGERVELARPLKSGGNLPQLAPDGSRVLYTRADKHPAGRQSWLVDIDGNNNREILNFGARRKVSASWFPNSRHILALVETTTHRRLGVYDSETGEMRWLIDDPTRNIEEAFHPMNGNQIVVLDVRNARNLPSLLDPVSGIETPINSAFAGNLLPLAPHNAGEWVGYYVSSRQPDDLVRFAPDETTPEKFVSLTRVWDQTRLTQEAFTPAKVFSWRSVDGLEIHSWLYRAKGKPRGTIVCVHGGPTWHTQDAYYPRIQYLARAGFNVLDPNYRGSTGFGVPFQEEIIKTGWGGLEQEDIRTGIEALLARGIAEHGKIGIMGVSYGGYSSWHAITHLPRDLVAAAVPICGMTDLVVDYETTRPDLRPYSAEMMGGTPDEAPDRFFERSPVNHVSNIRGRLLIVQGMQDPNVTPENVRVVTERLRQARVEYSVLAFEDEGHGVFRPKNVERLMEQAARFFADTFGTT